MHNVTYLQLLNKMQFKSETDPTDLNDSATFSRQKMSPRKCAQELNEHLKKISLVVSQYLSPTSEWFGFSYLERRVLITTDPQPRAPVKIHLKQTQEIVSLCNLITYYGAQYYRRYEVLWELRVPWLHTCKVKVYHVTVTLFPRPGINLVT